MAYLTMCHVYSMYTDYMNEKFDFLRTQMVITMKLTSFAYNYYDGTYDKEKVFSNNHENKSEQRQYAEKRKYAITSLPSFLEFFGYVYCFPTVLVGPAFEYKVIEMSFALSFFF
jgi:lysophospholipid acyltransferase